MTRARPSIFYRSGKYSRVFYSAGTPRTRASFARSSRTGASRSRPRVPDLRHPSPRLTPTPAPTRAIPPVRTGNHGALKASRTAGVCRASGRLRCTRALLDGAPCHRSSIAPVDLALSALWRARVFSPGAGPPQAPGAERPTTGDYVGYALRASTVSTVPVIRSQRSLSAVSAPIKAGGIITKTAVSTQSRTFTALTSVARPSSDTRRRVSSREGTGQRRCQAALFAGGRPGPDFDPVRFLLGPVPQSRDALSCRPAG